MMSPMQTPPRPVGRLRADLKVGPSIRRFCNTFFAVVTAALVGTACRESPPPRYQGLDRDLVIATGEKVLSETIGYHTVRVDQQGRILPWRTSDLGQASDDVLGRVCRFLSGFEIEKNGQPY